MSILDKFSEADLREFIALCTPVVGWEEHNAYQTATWCIKRYRNNPVGRPARMPVLELRDGWEKLCYRNLPNYSIFNDPLRLADLWACWVVYSRGYLLAMNSSTSLFGTSIVEDIGNINTIIDVGCGIGYTTAGLKELFPKATVFGTNLADTDEFELASLIGRDHGFAVKTSVDEIGEADLIFASEYFEHFSKPIEHLLEIINSCQPNYLIIANSFRAVSLGHYKHYLDGDRLHHGRTISRRFNDQLRALGYRYVATKCWDRRPAYWRKKHARKPTVSRFYYSFRIGGKRYRGALPEAERNDKENQRTEHQARDL